MLELRLSTASQETFEQVTAGTRWHNKWPRGSRDEHNSPTASLLPILATKPPKPPPVGVPSRARGHGTQKHRAREHCAREHRARASAPPPRAVRTYAGYGAGRLGDSMVWREQRGAVSHSAHA